MSILPSEKNCSDFSQPSYWLCTAPSVDNEAVEDQAGLSPLNNWAVERPWDTSGDASCHRKVSTDMVKSFVQRVKVSVQGVLHLYFPFGNKDTKNQKSSLQKRRALCQDMFSFSWAYYTILHIITLWNYSCILDVKCSFCLYAYRRRMNAKGRYFHSSYIFSFSDT